MVFELKIATEYNIRPANSSVILEPGIGSDGDTLEVYMRTDGDYAFGSIQVIDNQNQWVDSGAQLQLNTAPTDGEVLTSLLLLTNMIYKTLKELIMM